MRFPVDLTLFENSPHSPSFHSLTRSMNAKGRGLRDYCIPVNPYFPTPAMFAAFRDRLEEALKFYPAQNESIALALSRVLDLDPRTLVLGNGSTELITWINLLLVKESLAIPVPTFSRWTDEPGATGKRVVLFPTFSAANFQVDIGSFVSFVRDQRARVAILCNPNNPTGAFLPKEQVLDLLKRLSNLDLVVVDESFIDFADEDGIPSVAAEATRLRNVIVLKSLGKNFGLHGVRLGYAVSNHRLASTLRDALPYWNVNALGEMLIRELPWHLDEYEKGRRQVVRDRQELWRQLGSIASLRTFPSRANFVYFSIPEPLDGVALRNHLLTEHGCLVRECGNKVGSSSRYFRVAARPAEDREYLIHALRTSLSCLHMQDAADCRAA